MGSTAAGPRVAGLVLAAGRSTRMGESKPLLELAGRSFLERAVTALLDGGCAEVVAVVGAEDVAARAEALGAHVVHGRPDGEQIDSLRVGLDAVAADAVAVLPVDHPRVRAATVRSLLAAARARPEAVVRPVHDGRPGHPTVFPRRIWDRLRDPGLREGARTVVETADTVDVAVDDPGILVDIDTPAAYRGQVDGSS